VNISDKVEPWILNDPYIAGFPFTDANRQNCFGFIYKNRYHIGYSSTSSAPNTILVYDLIVQGWTVLQTTPGINCATTLNAPSDIDPFPVVVGSSASTQAYNWDIEPTAGTTVMDGTAPVFSQWQTKFYKVGVPGTNKALMRVYPEFFITGTLVGNFFVQTDYGSTQVQSEVINPVTAGSMTWDVSFWDESYWAGANAFAAFVAPQSRIDFPGTQGDSFSFGFVNTQAVSAYQFGGLSGVYNQRGRT
jgi:hypothetical protein